MLERNGEALWDPGPGMARKLFGAQRWVNSLAVKDEDDPSKTGPIDDVIPVGLARSSTIIPGIVSIDGYTEIHGAIVRAFGDKLVEGDPLQPVTIGESVNLACRVDGKDPNAWGVPNYYRFAYDWRRDIRSASQRLANLIDNALPALRQVSPDAKVVFVTHSMGGLVARYYVEGTNPKTGEPHEGWRNTRQLLTIGTPHRGSIDALSKTVNGFRKLFIDLTPTLLSMTSSYQLLPRYRCVLDKRENPSGDWIYPHEISDIADFDAARANASYTDFHAVIDGGVEAHRNEDDYPAYYVQPIIGFGNETNNSAILDHDGLTLSASNPKGVPDSFAGGDGTVPQISALPPDYWGPDGDDLVAVRHCNDGHGAMMTNKGLIAREVTQRLRKSQERSDRLAMQPEQGVASAIYLSHAAFWTADASGGPTSGDPVSDRSAAELTAQVKGIDDTKIDLTVMELGRPAVPLIQQTIESGDSLTLRCPPGEYMASASVGGGALETTSRFVVLEDR